ncbi:MAG: hypothetical protein JO157_09340 [Acetobacteraceae bacterium]|nr:hypothetical protein [Acetobacteraceae bacterium]
MSSAELDDIVASMEGALRRAYALGRQDAIDQLTRYLQSDDVVSQRLALAAPASDTLRVNDAEPAEPAGVDQPLADAAEQEQEERDSEPILPPPGAERPIIPNRPARGGLVESIRDFVYPSKID